MFKKQIYAMRNFFQEIFFSSSRDLIRVRKQSERWEVIISIQRFG